MLASLINSDIILCTFIVFNVKPSFVTLSVKHLFSRVLELPVWRVAFSQQEHTHHYSVEKTGDVFRATL